MQNQRPHSNQPQYRPGQMQDQSRVQGQPFPGAQFNPALSLLSLQQMQQQFRPQTGQAQGQLPGQLPPRPAAASMLPMSSQWAAGQAQMYQAIRQQNLAAQSRPASVNPAPAGLASASGLRTVSAAAKPAENASKKYNTKKRKAPEPTAAAAPPKTAPLPKERMPKSEILTKLQDQDDKVLKAVAQHKQVAHSVLRSGEHIKKKLRLYFQSEHGNQATSHGSPENSQSEEPAFWSFTVWGKLVDAVDSLQSFHIQQPPSHRHINKPFTSYLKRAVLTILSHDDKDGKPEEIIWTKANHKGEPRDRFYLRRQGSKDATIKIQLELDSQPEVIVLKDQLAQFMRCKLSTRIPVLQGLSTYFKMHNLQDGTDNIRCDSLLQRMFNRDSFRLSELPALIGQQCQPEQVYAIEYGVRPGGPAKGELACYDLDLLVPVNPGEQQSIPILDRMLPNSMLEHLQLKVNALITAASERSRRREMLLGFSNSPTDFINGLISSQARDLRAQKAGGNANALRRTQFFDSRWVDDAVLRYLHRKLAAGA